MSHKPIPHSVVHSRNFVPGDEGDVEHAPAEPPKDSKKDKGKKVRFVFGMLIWLIMRQMSA